MMTIPLTIAPGLFGHLNLTHQEVVIPVEAVIQVEAVQAEEVRAEEVRAVMTLMMMTIMSQGDHPQATITDLGQAPLLNRPLQDRIQNQVIMVPSNSPI